MKLLFLISEDRPYGGIGQVATLLPPPRFCQNRFSIHPAAQSVPGQIDRPNTATYDLWSSCVKTGHFPCIITPFSGIITSGSGTGGIRGMLWARIRVSGEEGGWRVRYRWFHLPRPHESSSKNGRFRTYPPINRSGFMELESSIPKEQ
jgi:hypothetical protein